MHDENMNIREHKQKQEFAPCASPFFLLGCTWNLDSQWEFFLWVGLGVSTMLYIGCGPLPVAVTARIITFLVGNPYKPLFATVTGKGPHPSYKYIYTAQLANNRYLCAMLWAMLLMVPNSFTWDLWNFKPFEKRDKLNYSLVSWISSISRAFFLLRNNYDYTNTQPFLLLPFRWLPPFRPQR